MILKTKNPGDIITAIEWNAMVEEIRRLSSITFAPPLLETKTPNGTLVSLGDLRTVYLCKLTGNRTGSGKYQCAVYVVNEDLRDSTRSVTTTDLESVLLFAEGTYVSLQEVSSATHWLTHANNANQKYFVGLRDGSDENGNPCFFGNGVWVKACA